MSWYIAIWLFPVAVLAHNVEEAIWLPGWSATKAGRWHKPVGAFEFRLAVTVLTLLAFFLAVMAHLKGVESIWTYLLAAYALGQGVNVFLPHLAAVFATRSYSPGLATGVVLVWPASFSLLYESLMEGGLEWYQFVIVTVLFVPAVLALIPILFRLGKSARRCLRLGSSSF